MRHFALLLLISIGLAGCDAPPCKPEGIDKAAAAYRECIAMIQNGDGGERCGIKAYNQYCKK